MIRDDNSKFLLYMEPNTKLEEPIDDEWTVLMFKAFEESEPGAANYSSVEEDAIFRSGSAFKGVHRCSCGEIGGNQDYLLKNGMITNSLCVHYLRWHRNEMSENDWLKLKMLKQYYEN